jgi:hypothetical protein
MHITMICFWNNKFDLKSFQWFYIRYIMLPSWSWSYVSWIYNDLCDRCISPLTLWVWFPLRRGVLDTTVCDKVYQWLVQVVGFRRVFRFSPPMQLTGTEILLKVVLNTITLSYVVTVPRTTCLFLWSLFLLLIKFTKQSMYNGVSQNSALKGRENKICILPWYVSEIISLIWKVSIL